MGESAGRESGVRLLVLGETASGIFVSGYLLIRFYGHRPV